MGSLTHNLESLPLATGAPQRRTRRPARLAFVGLGKFAQELATACTKQPRRITIASCFTRTAATRDAFARTFACGQHDSFEALCADPDIDGVVLATPNDTHGDQTVALARAGKHVFVEKPLCNTLDEADRMIAACAEAGVILAVGHQERRHSVYRRMKNMLTSGALGRVLAFEANHCGNLVGIWPKDDWRFDTARGVGPLLHKGIHKIDILNYLFGRAETVATLTIPLAINPAMPGTTVSVLGFRGGIIGSLTSGFEHNNSSFTISGSVRSIAYSGHGPSIRVKDERTWTFQEIDCGADDPLGEELGEFAEAVRGAGPVEVDGQAAREAIAVAVAAQSAAERGAVVQLDEFRHAAIAAESA